MIKRVLAEIPYTKLNGHRRRAKNSTNAKVEKRIIPVLAKNNGDKVYGELVYLSSVRGAYEKLHYNLLT